MAKRLTLDQKKEQCAVDLINEMFKIAGHEVTYDDIKDRKDAWYCEWTMTEEEYDQWLDWGKTYLKKVFKFNDNMAKRQMSMIGLNWGLKFKSLK